MVKLFSSTYKRYKHATDQVCQWIVDTATVHSLDGLNEPVPAAQSGTAPLPQQLSTRLKGKARKKARENKSSISSLPLAVPGVSKKVQLYKLTVKQLTRLARAIAQNIMPPIEVPLQVIKSLQISIRLRKLATKFYHGEGEGRETGTGSVIDGHEHFIRVLEEVLGFLELRCPEAKNGSKQQEDGEDVAAPLENQFSSLEIEDGEDLGDKETVAIPSASTDSTEAITAKATLVAGSELDALVEQFFAIHCMFVDMNKLREIVRVLWTQHKDGEMSLEAVSVATNAAILSMQSIEDDIRANFPNLDGYTSLLYSFYLPLCLERNEDPNFRVQPDDSYNYNMAGVGEWMCLSTYMMVDAMRRVITTPRVVPWVKPGFFGVYNPSADLSNLRTKLAQEKILLSEMFSEFCALEEIKASPLFEDELTKGMRALYASSKEPTTIWLIVAAQIFLDVGHILGNEVNNAVANLQQFTQMAYAEINLFIKFQPKNLGLRSKNHTPVWPASNNETVRNIQKQFEMEVLSDQLGAYKKLLKPDLARMMQLDRAPDFRLCGHHPLLCGTALLHVELERAELGINMASAWGSLLYLAHLYNALKKQGCLDVLWPPLEWFINYFTEERLFVGGYPTTPAECLKKYNLMMGMNPAAAATAASQGRQASVKLISKKGPRDWTAPSLLIQALNECYLRAGNPSAMLHKLSGLAQKSAIGSNGPKSRIEEVQDRGPGLLISIIADMVEEDELTFLKYNWQEMHHRCLNFFRILRDEFDSRLTKSLGKNYLDNENQLSSMVGWVFAMATEDVNANRLRRVGGEESPKSTVMIRVGELMKEFIGDEGIDADEVDLVAGNFHMSAAS